MSDVSHGPVALSATRGLLVRELKRFTRQPSRIAASIGTPLLLWGFLASGFAGSLAPGASADGASHPAGGYAAYLVPGSATLVALFASIFAAMSLIEDRREGYLRVVLVSPAPRWSLVSAKAGAGGLFATGQAAIVLLAGPIIGMRATIMGMIVAFVMLAFTSIALTALGLAAAWKVNSSEGFHGVMNAVLMPMWLLSGALFPVGGAASWLKPVMYADPLYWATEAVRTGAGGELGLAPALVTIAFAVAAVTFASLVIGRD